MHGAAIAKGSDPKHLMAELLTRTTGCCKGRGGSMHRCDRDKWFLGTNAIVAAHIRARQQPPIAQKHAAIVASSKIRDGAAMAQSALER